MRHRMLIGFGMSFLVLITAIGSTFATPVGPAAKPRTVLDYYLLLPDKYFEASKEQRAGWMLEARRGSVVDVKRGYLFAQGDGAQMSVTVCLFKNRDGSHLIGVKSSYWEDVESSRLEFFRYVDGAFVDVTRGVVPIAQSEDLKHEMPRYGTTIKVSDKDGRRIYDLVWNRQKFELRRFSESSVPVAAPCLEYEPNVVTLSGTLVRQTFPGPPNYTNIRRGDKPERYLILKLRKPICVEVADHFDIHEEGQTQIQLVLEPKQYQQFRNLIGKRVTATGKLFHAHTGHHHKPLLLTTSEIRRTAVPVSRR